MSTPQLLTVGLIFGITAALPLTLAAYFASRTLTRQMQRHKEAMEQAARRAFDNARLSNWQQIAASGMHDRHHYKEYRRNYNRHQHNKITQTQNAHN